MKILTISGSSRPDSSNSKLLKSLPQFFPNKTFQHYSINDLPLFKAENNQHPWEDTVLNWRKAVAESDAVIICTPEYIHNLPALLKNALEWVTSSGELMQKKVLAMTFTPHESRGEKAMQSLLWSLKALDAHVVCQLALYQNEIELHEGQIKAEKEVLEMLEEAVNLL